jgi:hypothetical protein
MPIRAFICGIIAAYLICAPCPARPDGAGSNKASGPGIPEPLVGFRSGS